MTITTRRRRIGVSKVIQIVAITTIVGLFTQSRLLKKVVSSSSKRQSEELLNEPMILSTFASATGTRTSHEKKRQPQQQQDTTSNIDDDQHCPFRHSPIYRSIYVYPSPGEDDWNGDILSEYASNVSSYPWIAIDQKQKKTPKAHYNPKSKSIQYNTELLVRDIILHPNSCLRTNDPDKATLFYVPYLPSIEYHNGTEGLGDYQTSPFGQALMDATEGNYSTWERVFGLSSDYWKRRNGSDHILVMSEPLHGLWHPKTKRGNFHFIHSQKQLTPPIVVSVELSTTFVQKFPNCARKNILMPYPNTDGRWFNGKLDASALEIFQKQHNLTVTTSNAALTAEQEIAMIHTTTGEHNTSTSTILRLQPRPLAQFYSAGHHGSCATLRKSMTQDYQCSDSSKATKPIKKLAYEHGYRQATFCPCPGGDSPSAKRMFDALHAGCIPLILSHDYVWPLTEEFDIIATNNNNHTSASSSSILLNPNDFSIRLQADEFVDAKHDENCRLLQTNATTTTTTTTTATNYTTTQTATTKDLQAFIETISANEIQRLRKGAQRAADTYSYYRRSRDLPDNPLKEGILPDGGAAQALVQLLSERASGVLWPACQKELLENQIITTDQQPPNLKKNKDDPYGPYRFKC